MKDVSVDEIRRRLGIPAEVGRMCTQKEAQEIFPGQPFAASSPNILIPGERIGSHGRWTFLIDVEPHGLLLEPEILTRLSKGTEAVSVWYVLGGTVKVAHALDGRMQSTFDAWTFQPPTGAAPEQLDQMLRAVGFFSEVQEEAMEEDGWTSSKMVLAALERGFGLELPVDMMRGRMLTVGLPREETHRCNRPASG